MEYKTQHTTEDRRAERVAFTGHRDFRGGDGGMLRTTVELLYKRGKRVFLSGMAVGFDLAAAEAVVAVRRAHPDIRLVAVVPFRGQQETYSLEDQYRFLELTDAADQVVVLAEGYSREVYMVRNNYLIDHASTLVTWYDGHEGGTRYTVERALKHRLRLLHLNPRTPIEVYPDPELF